MGNRFKSKIRYLAIIGILVFTVFTGTLIYARGISSGTSDSNNKNVESMPVTSSIPTEGNQKPISIGKPKDNAAVINDTYKSKGISEKSPNGESIAEVVTKDGLKYDTVIFKGKDNTVHEIDLVDILYTGIESKAWIDDTRYAILGHINPSLQVYVVMDAKKNEITSKNYGIGFTWNQLKDKFYYVETSPHFAAEKSSDKIVDSEGNIYYETEPGISLTNKISVSNDGRTFAFFANDSKSESTKLYVGELNNDKKLEIQSKIDANIGDIKINDNKSVEIITPDADIQ